MKPNSDENVTLPLMVVLCNYQLQPRGVPGGGREENVSEVSNWKYHYPLHIVAFSISLPDVTAKKTFLKTHPQKKRTFCHDVHLQLSALNVNHFLS